MTTFYGIFGDESGSEKILYILRKCSKIERNSIIPVKFVIFFFRCCCHRYTKNTHNDKVCNNNKTKNGTMNVSVCVMCISIYIYIFFFVLGLITFNFCVYSK